MKTNKTCPKTIGDKIWEKTGLSFWQDYSNLIRPQKYNWVNFRWICLDMEWDKAGNSFDIEIGILGLNMRWQIGLPGTTEQKEELMRRLKEVKGILDDTQKANKGKND